MLMVSELLSLARQKGTSDLGGNESMRFGQAGSAPQVVVWNVCLQCNMTCPHCYAGSGDQKGSGELNTAEGMKLLEDLAAAGVKAVIFSGGEPLLRNDLETLIRQARSLGMGTHLSSNGTLIDGKTADMLASAGISYVGVSVDGSPGFNDEYRGFSGGFEKALQGLKNAKGAGMKTGLRLTLTRRNAQEVGAMAELTAGQGIDRFYLSHLVYSGRGKHLTGEDLPPEETRMQLLELFLLAERMLEQGQPLRIVTGANDSGGPLLLRWIGERYGQEAGGKIHTLLKRRGGNSAGERLLAITHRGDVHPDQFWRKDTLGNVRRESLAEILAHPLLAMLRERDRHITGRCSGCAYLEICRGSHRERALAATGDVWSSDPACVMRDSEITTPAKVVAGGMA